MGPDDQCALTVLPAATSISEHIVRVLPYVHQDKNVLLCFLGYIKNQKDLEAKLDVDRSTDDVGATTTSLIAGLYSSLMEDKKEDLLLSELQGTYAFFLYDLERKQSFAARDPSGEQELFFCLDEDGSVAFTNSLESLPVTEKSNKWRELLPGHYVSGKTPSVRQFALTPEQLETLRERQSSGGDEDILDWLDEDIEGSPTSLHHTRLSPSDDVKPGLFRRLSKRMIPSSTPRRASVCGSIKEI